MKVYYKQYETKFKGKIWCWKNRLTTHRGFKTKFEAVQDYAHWEKIHVRKGVKMSEYTVNDAMLEWFDWYKTLGKKKSTYQIRKTREMPKIRKYLGSIKLANLTDDEVQSFYESLKNEGYAKTTLQGVKQVLGMILKYSVRKSWVFANVSQGVPLPSYSKSIAELKLRVDDLYLSQDELNQFLVVAKTIEGTNMFGIMLTLAYTGMRISEALGLTIEDLDFEKNEIAVYKQVYVEDGKTARDFEITTTKTETRRDVRVPTHVMDALLEISKANAEVRKYAKVSIKEHFLFTYLKPGSFGVPFRYEYVNDHIKRIAEKAGIKKKVTTHRFRHTQVSLLAQANVPIEVIQERVGHADEKTTKLIYLHVTKDSKEQAVDALEELLVL
jgi:integrase